jgi:small-conductance mechanosensitive channel
MIDYIVRFTYWIDDLEFSNDTVITIQEGYIEDQNLLEDILMELLKEDTENENVEIIDFEELTQTEQANLYRITADDVYYNDEYMYKGDIGDKAEKFTGKSMEEVLDIIKEYNYNVDWLG